MKVNIIKKGFKGKNNLNKAKKNIKKALGTLNTLRIQLTADVSDITVTDLNVFMNVFKDELENANFQLKILKQKLTDGDK